MEEVLEFAELLEQGAPPEFDGDLTELGTLAEALALPGFDAAPLSGLVALSETFDQLEVELSAGEEAAFAELQGPELSDGAGPLEGPEDASESQAAPKEAGDCQADGASEKKSDSELRHWRWLDAAKTFWELAKSGTEGRRMAFVLPAVDALHAEEFVTPEVRCPCGATYTFLQMGCADCGGDDPLGQVMQSLRGRFDEELRNMARGLALHPAVAAAQHVQAGLQEQLEKVQERPEPEEGSQPGCLQNATKRIANARLVQKLSIAARFEPSSSPLAILSRTTFAMWPRLPCRCGAGGFHWR